MAHEEFFQMFPARALFLLAGQPNLSLDEEARELKSEGMRSMRVKESTSSACSGSANVLQGSPAGEGTEGLAVGEVIGTGS